MFRLLLLIVSVQLIIAETDFLEELGSTTEQCLENFGNQYQGILLSCKTEHKDEYMLNSEEYNETTKEFTVSVGILDGMFVFLGPLTQDCVMAKLATEMEFMGFIRECREGKNDLGIFLDPLPVMTCAFQEISKYCGSTVEPASSDLNLQVMLE